MLFFSLSYVTEKKETGISYCCWNNDVSLHSFFSSRVPLLSRSLFLLFFLFPFPGFCCVCFLHGRRSLKHLDFLFTRPSLKSRSSGTTTTRKKHDEIKKKENDKCPAHTHSSGCWAWIRSTIYTLGKFKQWRQMGQIVREITFLLFPACPQLN